MKKSIGLIIVVLVYFVGSIVYADTVKICNHSNENIYVAEFITDGDTLRHFTAYKEVPPIKSANETCADYELQTTAYEAYLTARNEKGDHIWGVGGYTGCQLVAHGEETPSWSVTNHDDLHVNCNASKGLRAVVTQVIDLTTGSPVWNIQYHIGNTPLDMMLPIDKEYLTVNHLTDKANQIQTIIDANRKVKH